MVSRATSSQTLAIVLSLAFSGACGARSSLGEEDAPGAGNGGGGRGGAGQGGRPAGPGSGGEVGHGGSGATGGAPDSTATVTVETVTTGPLCTSDEECNDGSECTIDFCTDSSGCLHDLDPTACDDGLACTIDGCDATGACTNTVNDAVCDDGLLCTIDYCDLVSDSCVNDPCDNRCDDGSFCNGVERCDSQLGCASGPGACVLPMGCATSACDEASEQCAHGFPAGCTPPTARLLITDNQGRLFEVRPFETPSETLVAAANGLVHLDIAILPSGRWFTADDRIYELQPFTNTIIENLAPNGSNSLGAGPDGMLYAASTLVFRIDPDTGATMSIAELPPGHTSSGDIAFLGSRLFVSTDSPCGGALVEVDPATGATSVLGGDGLGCVWGLANVGGELFVVNCDGKVGIFDPDSGEVTIVATTTAQAYGADAL